jgi:hypothetical protein
MHQLDAGDRDRGIPEPPEEGLCRCDVGAWR